MALWVGLVGLTLMTVSLPMDTAAKGGALPRGTYSAELTRDPVPIYVTLHPSCEAIVRQAEAKGGKANATRYAEVSSAHPALRPLRVWQPAPGPVALFCFSDSYREP